MERLVPKRALPDYTYIPGLTARPVDEEPAPSVIDGTQLHEEWERCEEYLYGVDLFNAGFYWEAHEAWEAVWNLAGRRGVTADFIKGLIKLAAAGVKAREGNSNGLARHAARAQELFETVAASDDRRLGLSVEALMRWAHEASELSLPLNNNDAERVFPVFQFQLRPDLRA